MSLSSGNTPFEPSVETKRDPLILPPVAFQGDLLAALQARSGGMWAEAWRLACLAIEERPFHPEGWVFLSEVAASVGHRSLARRCAEKAVALTPNWEPARRQLSTISVEQDNPTLLLTDPPLRAGLPPRLSVCLIAKNEERFLDGCLSSVRNLADQIVLVDTGSTDRTVEIARAHGVEVYFQAWDDDFSAARNASLMHARGDWILILDADEEVSRDHHDALRRLLVKKNMIAYRLPMDSVGEGCEGSAYVPRLLANAPMQFYVCRIHEQIYPSIILNKEKWSMQDGLGDARLAHYGYQAQLVRDRNKVKRNLDLLNKANNEFPNDVNVLMNLGLEHQRSGQKQLAEGYYKKSYETMNRNQYSQTSIELREILMSQYASFLLDLHRCEEVVSLFNDGAILPGNITSSHHFILGIANLKIKKWDLCAHHMRLCLQLRNRQTLTPVHRDVKSGLPARYLAHALIMLGQKFDAFEFYEQSLKDEPTNNSVRVEFAGHLIKEKQTARALGILHDGVVRNPNQANLWEFGARLALSQKETLEFALDWTQEALNQLPDHDNLRQLRADTLLFNGRPEEALDFWVSIDKTTDVQSASGHILCKVFTGEPLTVNQLVDESAVNRDIMRRYQHAVRLGQEDWVQQLHAKLGLLKQAAPTAAELIRQIAVDSSPSEE